VTLAARKNSKTPSKKASHEDAAKSSQVRFSQTEFPAMSLQKAQGIASALVENFAAKDASPPDVALAMGISPSSSAWRYLTGSSIAYGLTEGGWNADKIKLTSLGKRLAAPEVEGDDVAARRDAILKPNLLKAFFERYRRAKFPNDTIAKNVLVGIGVPAERVAAALEVVRQNGRYAGIIKDTPTGPFVSVDSPSVPAPVATSIGDEDQKDDTDQELAEGAVPPPVRPQERGPAQQIEDAKARRIFITHGKQKGIVAQLKELLAYGNFEPIVSVERESTAISVPEKVFEDMRSCGAGVIHVSAEGTYKDRDGNEKAKINDNVLIEIGAALALYGRKIVLLVDKVVAQLPTNLQGLYRCDYEGDKLDYEATMKLLKTFNQFK
jgi:hypothetical protein